eukprot:22518_1
MNIIGISPPKNYSGINNKIADYLSRDIEWHNYPQITPEHGKTEIIPDSKGRLFNDEQSKLFYQTSHRQYKQYFQHINKYPLPFSNHCNYIFIAHTIHDTTLPPTVLNQFLHTHYSKDDHILGENTPHLLKSNQPLNNIKQPLNNIKSYIPSCYYHKPSPKSHLSTPNFKNNKYKLFFNYNRNTIAYYNGHFGNFNNKIF